MRLYDAEDRLVSVADDFTPHRPDEELLGVVRDVCFGANVVLYDDCLLYITYRRPVTDDFSDKRDAIFGAVIAFDQFTGKAAGNGSFFVFLDNYKENRYRITWGGVEGIPTRVLKQFPEAEEAFGVLSDLITDNGHERVLKNLLILDRHNRDVDKNMRWFIYSRIKAVSTNAHFKGPLIYFKLKDSGAEGIVRVCAGGRLECLGNFYPTPDSFLTAFNKDIAFDMQAYGSDREFISYAHDTEREEI